MFDLIFDGMATFHGLAFMLGALLFLAVGAGFIIWWLSWRIKGYRVKGRIVAVKSTGKQYSNDYWLGEYEKESRRQNKGVKGDPGFLEGMKSDFKKGPIKMVFVGLFLMLFALMPFGFFGLGAYFAYDYLNLSMTGEEVPATISSYETTYDSESGTSYYPVVSYKDLNGRGYNIKDKLGTGSKSYATGEDVTVFYDPDDPERFVIHSFWRYMGFAFAFMGMGGIFIALMAYGAYVNITGGVPERALTPEKKRRGAERLKRQYYINQHYIPVYEFNGPGGKVIRAEGHDDATNWLADKLPGRAVKLMVVPDKKGGPPKVKRPGKMFLIFGLVFLFPGLFLMKFAISQIKFSFGGIAVMLGALGWGGYKLFGMIKENIKGMTEEELRTEWKSFKIESETVHKKGYEMSQQDIRERLRLLDRNSIIAVPFLLLFGVGMMIGGYHLFQDLNDLSGKAMVAQGQVVDMNGRSNSDGGYTYYPVIGFMTLTGETARFEGSVGSNPPMYQTGDKVIVLYDPDKPERAIIDHGWMNWLPSIGLILVGLLCFIHGIRLMTGITRRANRI